MLIIGSLHEPLVVAVSQQDLLRQEFKSTQKEAAYRANILPDKLGLCFAIHRRGLPHIHIVSGNYLG